MAREVVKIEIRGVQLRRETAELDVARLGNPWLNCSRSFPFLHDACSGSRLSTLVAALPRCVSALKFPPAAA